MGVYTTMLWAGSVLCRVWGLVDFLEEWFMNGADVIAKIYTPVGIPYLDVCQNSNYMSAECLI